MKTMKHAILALILIISFPVLSQKAETEEGKQNPRTLNEREWTAQERAEFEAFQVVKACNIDNKEELSELVRVFFEYELDMELSRSSIDLEAIKKMNADLDDEIKGVIGNQRMAAYQDWKGKSKPWEQSAYAD